MSTGSRVRTRRMAHVSIADRQRPRKPPMTTSRPGALLLFDIDGTLLVTGGVAREAFSCAVRDVFRIEDDLTGVEFAGRTEPLIVADILARRGLSFRDGDEPRFW